MDDVENGEASGVAMIDEEERLHALAELHILDTPPEERFDRVTRLCTGLFGVSTALVSLIDSDRQWFKSAQGLDVPETPRDIAFCNIAIQQAGAMVVEDAQNDARFADNPLVTGEPHIRFYAGYPLTTRGGYRIGTLCLIDQQPRKVTVLEMGLLQDLAMWVQNELVIDEELERAAAVQQGLLPRRPPDLAGYEVAGRVVSSWLVGGDFVDWFATPSGTALCLADVMGKGMGGAILMATVRAVLRTAAGYPSLGDGVAQTAFSLADDLEQTGSFFTLFLVRAQGLDGDFRYIDAGHGLACVVRVNGTFERLETRGLPVGMLDNTKWNEGTLRLEPGDSLVVCSDGMLDVRGGAENRDDVERVISEVAQITCAQSSAEGILDALTQLPKDQPDDVSVLVIRRV